MSAAVGKEAPEEKERKLQEKMVVRNRAKFHNYILVRSYTAFEIAPCVWPPRADHCVSFLLLVATCGLLGYFTPLLFLTVTGDFAPMCVLFLRASAMLAFGLEY